MSAFLQKDSLTLLGHFFRESSEHLSETKDAEPFLFRLIWLSSLLSRLICYYPHPISIIKLLICFFPLLPLMLHYRPTAMFDCYKSIFFTLLRSARTSCITFTSCPSIRLREFLVHITFFVLIYFYFYQLIRIPKLQSFAHQVAWIKNKRIAKWSFSIVFTLL